MLYNYYFCGMESLKNTKVDVPFTPKGFIHTQSLKQIFYEIKNDYGYSDEQFGTLLLAYIIKSCGRSKEQIKEALNPLYCDV